MKNIFAVAAALTLLAGAPVAFADSLDSPQARGEFPALTNPVTSSPLVSETNNEGQAQFAAAPQAGLTQGDLLATNGVNGILQTANSAPVGFGAGGQTEATVMAGHIAHRG
jgi:hypothetical protein